jgi:hypothetical protein
MVSRELRWLGYYLVREGVMEPEQVRELAATFTGDPDFVDFAQLVVDKEFTPDYELVQNLVDQSFAKADTSDDPPVNIFKAAVPVPAAVPAAAPAATTEPAPLPIRLRMTSEKPAAPAPAAPAAKSVAKETQARGTAAGDCQTAARRWPGGAAVAGQAGGEW